MSAEKRPLKVFLCHARDDKSKVRELYRYLRKYGIQPWLDTEDLLAGQEWQVEIPKTIVSSDAIIICLSKNSVSKEGFIQKEIKFALDKVLEMPEGRVFIIPVRFEECDVPSDLKRYHWVDLFEVDGYTKLLESLIALAQKLGREIPKEPTLPPPPWGSMIMVTVVIIAAIVVIAALIGSLLQSFKPIVAPTATRTVVTSSTQTQIPTFTTLSPSETPIFISTPTLNPQPTVQISRPGTYTTRMGEFPYCIARRFDVDPFELYALNGLTIQEGEALPPGTTLKIPTSGNIFPPPRALKVHPTTYVVQTDDTIYSIACFYGDVDPMDIVAVNGLSAPYTLTPGSEIQIP